MQDIFVGRQAIFDRDMQVFAYELLYREGQGASKEMTDGNLASSRVILNTLLEIGLEQLVNEKKAFINLTRTFFTDPDAIPFDPDKVVLEILEDIPVDDDFVEQVRTLHQAGYTIALDDYNFESKWEPLYPYISIIKVEIPAVDRDLLPDQIKRLHQHIPLLLAEKVESLGDYLWLRDLGFDYFQGFFFSRPNVVSAKRVGESQMVVLQLLARLNDPMVDIDEIDRLISRDPGLSLKVLRYINSAAVALPRKVESIHQAVIYIGMQKIRAWATLISMAAINNKPSEVFNLALVRAHHCALLLKQTTPSLSEMGFTTGLLSILDTLMDQPLEPLVKDLPLTDEIKTGLLNRSGEIGLALNCTLAYEEQRWNEAQFPDLSINQILDTYLQSTQQAFAELKALETH